MPRRAPVFQPVDPTPAVLTADQLAVDGVVKRPEAMKLLKCGETQLKRLIREKKVVSYKRGKDRLFPVAGLRAFIATELREAGVAS